MKKLLILGALALGLSVAAPQAHSQVRVHVRAHTRLIARPRVGLSVNLGTPAYQPYYGSTVIVGHPGWHRGYWARRRRFARMEYGR